MRGEAARLLHCLGKSQSGAVSPVGPDLPREEKFMQVKGSQPRPKVSGSPTSDPDPNSKSFQIHLVRPLINSWDLVSVRARSNIWVGAPVDVGAG